MAEKLIDLEAGVLLRKFGAGEHKPGSGSAAAYQGMLSAQLIKTVISITTDEKRKKRYKASFAELKKMEAEINSRIYPKLEVYFQKDSEIFDEAIRLRVARDNAKERKLQIQLEEEALEGLKPATEMPVEIAKLCVDLAHYGIFIFDNGFRSVRGDSGVALNTALSAIGDCLAIIDLNLSSFSNSNWTENIRNETLKIRKEFAEITLETKIRLNRIQKEAELKNKFKEKINNFNSGEIDESSLKYDEIEALAKELQNTLWTNRELIWQKDTPSDPLEIIQPEKILKVLGYRFSREMSLGEHSVGGRMLETAGLIDRESKYIAVSEQYSEEIQRFTIAHEIGHALLHKHRILHRDKALDGSDLGSRDNKEKQADKFASFLLMPEKQVKRAFKDLFGMERFILNEETLFLLKLRTPEEFLQKFKHLRGFTRYLASTENFNRKNFKSLNNLFGVSVETMAIRLEEIDLAEFDF